jgi:hypothetical protein
VLRLGSEHRLGCLSVREEVIAMKTIREHVLTAGQVELIRRALEDVEGDIDEINDTAEVLNTYIHGHQQEVIIRYYEEE